ncbi:MAG: esterase [Acidobacteriota bacterium]
MGSFHIGGRDVEIAGKVAPDVQLTPGVAANINPNGTYAVEQMYVQYFLPSRQRGQLPLLLWHGAWLTGATYETTPDGREGWLNYFVKLGWPVYLSDAVERGRAGWAMYPDVFKGEPIFLTKDNAYERFRIGKGPGSYAKREAYPGTQFPLDAYDQFVKQAVPRWTTNNAATVAAYVALVDKVCPCVVLVHSQSGQFGASVAEQRPDKVKALIMVEPSNGGNLQQAANLKNTPILTIWGDFVDEDPRWSQNRKVVNAYYDAVRAGGGVVDIMKLPDQGMHGNSHMVMMDKNSDQVAGLIQKWLEAKKLYR